MRYLKPLMVGLRAFRRSANRRPFAVACESKSHVRPESKLILREAIVKRASQHLSSRSHLLLERRATNGSTEFPVNSSNRFSALAEAAPTSTPAGQSLPGQCEARFRLLAAEQSFVLRTRPAAAARQFQFISSPTRAPFGGVASDARYLNACARH